MASATGRNVASRSVVLRPQRESSVTSTASSCRAWASAITLLRSARSSFTPDAGLLVDADDLVAGSLGKSGEVALLPLA